MTKTWSSQQTDIFDFFANGTGNLVVRARAGTGKTTTIIEACGHAPASEKILLAAFNKKIAEGLTARVAAPNVEAKTLHGLGFAYIRRQWSNVKVDASVDFDRAAGAAGKSAPDEMVRLVAKLASLLKACAPLTTDPEVVIGIAEEFDCVPDETWEEEGWTTDSVAACAITARDFAKTRDADGRISFDDMIFIPVACGFARPWYTLVVIDEAQDMNASQLMLAQAACKKTGRIVVVGDDCQAIYGFRGADADGIDRLKNELSAKELGLKTTYRCAKNIVEVAQKYVPDFESGSPYLGIVDEMAAGSEDFFKAAQPGDFVLSRKNAPLMAICLGFLRRGVRARIEGRDVAAGLRAIVKSVKAKSIPNFIEKVGTWAGKQIARAKKLTNESARSNKIAAIEDQRDMLIALVEGCTGMDEAMNRIDTLFGDTTPGTTPAAVVCSSVHRSKGLEAERVFVLQNTIKDSNREEKNIAYVAYTRAKNHLTMLVTE
ncbi:MAG TPA: ATP-dependent helicase [Vicinamibacterales bacterium]|jgi:superfamily I DNA/RNA helicase|nr:ATP-dependent helicase [Vicinamibacterales bacterium]